MELLAARVALRPMYRTMLGCERPRVVAILARQRREVIAAHPLRIDELDRDRGGRRPAAGAAGAAPAPSLASATASASSASASSSAAPARAAVAACDTATASAALAEVPAAGRAEAAERGGASRAVVIGRRGRGAGGRVVIVQARKYTVP